MALSDPRALGIECILKSVAEVNDFVDDLEWWRANLRNGDTVNEVVARMPLPDDMKGALQRDVARLGDLGQQVLVAALHIAVERAEAIDVNWRSTGPPAVQVAERDGNTLEILVYLDCGD